ncbi:hypothetical protein VTN00DRAFT_4678 [Thermoascus crustaceus]|uniref:uncharacterized protein n=1 Tax=Thermoascus crustaceus TaxID=5088 RepID=UPI003743F22D
MVDLKLERLENVAVCAKPDATAGGAAGRSNDEADEILSGSDVLCSASDGRGKRGGATDWGQVQPSALLQRKEQATCAVITPAASAYVSPFWGGHDADHPAPLQRAAHVATYRLYYFQVFHFRWRM